MLVKDNLLVIRMDVAGLTQWGSSWPRERVCGRGGIRKNCGNPWKSWSSLSLLEEIDQFVYGHFNIAQYGTQQAGT